MNGVIHAHPITSVALSIAGIPLTDCIIPEAIVFLSPIPTTPYATPSSAENQQAISELVKTHDAIVLAYHGTITVGPTLWDAYLKLESLEHTAKIIALARMLGGASPLTPDQVQKLIDTRRKLGYARSTDAVEFCKYCGVPHSNTTSGDEETLVKAIAEEVRKALASTKA